jgi:hypothetical protein
LILVLVALWAGSTDSCLALEQKQIRYSQLWASAASTARASPLIYHARQRATQAHQGPVAPPPVAIEEAGLTTEGMATRPSHSS